MLSARLAKASVAFDSIQWNCLYLLLIFQYVSKSFLCHYSHIDQLLRLALLDLKLPAFFSPPFLCFPFSKGEQSTYNIISSFYFLVLLSLEFVFLGSPWKGSFICWITLKGG